MHTQKNIGRFWLYGLYMAVALIFSIQVFLIANTIFLVY